ncbi:MAG: hypothetical protein AB7G11_17790 [Phycisphaerales bacterium]
MKFRGFVGAAAMWACVGLAGDSQAGTFGSIFLTGHDPDFHAFAGGNLTGARRINQVAISFVMDPAFNPYVAGGINRFLFVESSISPPGGHVDGEQGIIMSGYTPGVDYDRVPASGLNAALDQLGTTYSAIVVASDFGGILTQGELDILNARAVDIADFVNSGGGLYAMAESNSGAHLTPNGGHFAFVPTITAAVSLDQSEVGFTVSPFGASLGLTDADVNGNASHNFFQQLGGLQPVDFDAAGRVMSAAGRVFIPGPGGLVMMCVGAGLAVRRRR